MGGASGLPQGSAQSAMGRRAAGAAGTLLAVEILGSLLMWGPVPLAWLWVGARAYDVSGSIVLDGSVVLSGFLATWIVVMGGLSRVDGAWVVLRRRAGHEQPQGALIQVVIASAALGILLFLLWFYVFERAFVIPFLGSQ